MSNNCDNRYLPGSIYCNFDNDWCNFESKNVGDDVAKKGFNWMRKNSNEVENQGLDGPDHGKHK